MERYQVFLNYQILEEIPRTGKSRSAVLAFIASLEMTHSKQEITPRSMKLAALFLRKLWVAMPSLFGPTLQTVA